MPALGHNGSLQAVKEVTWGINPGSGYTAQAIQSETFDQKQSYIFTKPVQGTRSAPLQKIPGGILAGGAINFDADVEGILGLLLKNILSSETCVDNGAGNGGTHTFTPANALPPSLSVLINRDNTGMSTNVWQAVGAKVGKLSLSASEGGLLKAVATLSAKSFTASATASAPTYTTQNPLVYHTGALTLAGATNPTVNIKSFKLDISSGLHDKRGQIGSKYIQEQQPGLFGVTGELEAYFDSMSQVNAYLNATDVTCELNLTGSALGSSTRGLDILMPVVQLTGSTTPISGAGNELMQKLPFTAWLSGAGSPNALIQAILTNSQRTAY